jgi:uncharacterized membrane protein YvbJ
MVYCEECGKQNEDEAEYCSKCGNPLKEDQHRRRSRDYRRQQRDECFGLPHGNIIVPIIIGVILILSGLSSVYGFNIWMYIWPALIIIIGLLIILGAIYRARRSDY